MRTIVCMGAVLMLAASAVFGQDNFFRPMKGTDAPEFELTDDNGRCLVFRYHIVKTTQSEDGGENLDMWDRQGTAKGTAACNPSANPYTTIKDSDNNAFYGMTEDYFFIDTGTSVDSRTLYVYNTDSGYEVTKVGYQNEPSLVGGRFLMYDEPSDRKGPISTCKDAAKWKRQGGGVGWVQGKKMDLNTQKTINVGVLRCVYME